MLWARTIGEWSGFLGQASACRLAGHSSDSLESVGVEGEAFQGRLRDEEGLLVGEAERLLRPGAVDERRNVRADGNTGPRLGSWVFQSDGGRAEPAKFSYRSKDEALQRSLHVISS
jgi:hypothetical protein